MIHLDPRHKLAQEYAALYVELIGARKAKAKAAARKKRRPENDLSGGDIAYRFCKGVPMESLLQMSIRQNNLKDLGSVKSPIWHFQIRNSKHAWTTLANQSWVEKNLYRRIPGCSDSSIAEFPVKVVSPCPQATIRL